MKTSLGIYSSLLSTSLTPHPFFGHNIAGIMGKTTRNKSGMFVTDYVKILKVIKYVLWDNVLKGGIIFINRLYSLLPDPGITAS